MVVAETHLLSEPRALKAPVHDTRARLLDAAIDLIWENSYGAVGVSDICERAQVNKGSFYHFFNSKSDLAVAAYERHWQASVPRFERIFAADVPPLLRLKRYCEAIHEVQRARRKLAGKVCGCPFAALGCELGTQDERLRRTSSDILALRARYLEATLRDAAAAGEIPPQDFQAVAKSMSALVGGSLLQARIENDLDPIVALLQGIYSLIAGFVPPRPAAGETRPRHRNSKGNPRCGS
jgi:TetR/AcrR family transcriptional regulator, transcriptional repressor for nem operon